MSDIFECKTNNKGEFTASKSFDVPTVFGKLLKSEITLSGSLTSPEDTTVEGLLKVNSSSKAFKNKKTGDNMDFGTFKLQEKNTIVLSGTATTGKDAAPAANTQLKFTVDH